MLAWHGRPFLTRPCRGSYPAQKAPSTWYGRVSSSGFHACCSPVTLAEVRPSYAMLTPIIRVTNSPLHAPTFEMRLQRSAHELANLVSPSYALSLKLPYFVRHQTAHQTAHRAEPTLSWQCVGKPVVTLSPMHIAAQDCLPRRHHRQRWLHG